MRLARIDANHAIIPSNVLDVVKDTIQNTVTREGASPYIEQIPVVRVIMIENYFVELEITSKDPDALEKVYVATMEEINLALAYHLTT